MKKNLKEEQGEQKVLRRSHALNKLLVIWTMLCFLAFPSIALSEETIPVARDISQGENMELIQNDITVEDAEIEPINTKKVKDTVVPDPSKEGKKVIGLFIKTMMAVAFCAIVIYLILIFVKKFFASAFINHDFEELENLDLATPNNKQDAIRSFLNRTK